MVAGQIVDTTTHGLPNLGLVNSETGRLADWTAHRLLSSPAGQLADAVTSSSCNFD